MNVSKLLRYKSLCYVHVNPYLEYISMHTAWFLKIVRIVSLAHESYQNWLTVIIWKHPCWEARRLGRLGRSDRNQKAKGYNLVWLYKRRNRFVFPNHLKNIWRYRTQKRKDKLKIRSFFMVYHQQIGTSLAPLN